MSNSAVGTSVSSKSVIVSAGSPHSLACIPRSAGRASSTQRRRYFSKRCFAKLPRHCRGALSPANRSFPVVGLRSYQRTEISLKQWFSFSLVEWTLVDGGNSSVRQINKNKSIACWNTAEKGSQFKLDRTFHLWKNTRLHFYRFFSSQRRAVSWETLPRSISYRDGK